jgi:hypothetical protein
MHRLCVLTLTLIKKWQGSLAEVNSIGRLDEDRSPIVEVESIETDVRVMPY